MTDRHAQDKYGVFWYNEQEILHWGDEDFEEKAREFAEAGINIVMTFSCTHFRWSFYPWFEQITAALAKIVCACHHHGIRVVEHHSSHLTHNPRSAREWMIVHRHFQKRNSTVTMFSGLSEYIASGDPEILPGVHLSDCRQIDGRTGDFARTLYNGYGHCFNNPDFRKAYFAYLERIYATGVDGIMTDDVQYFGDFNACTCKYCREKFRKESGFELPAPDAWATFHGDYSNPAFLEWLRFRMRSTEEFHREVNAHFRSLGLKLIRPNYACSTFGCNQVAYPFESAADLWDCVFQENMFSSVIRTAWPQWHSTAEHRFSLARRHHIMAMSMFYPSRYDDYYFCWALAKAWNHLLMATPEGGDINEIEKHFSSYDCTNPIPEDAEEFADIEFWEPRASLDFVENSLKEAVWPMDVWLQGGTFRNLRFAIVFEDDPLEELLRLPFLMLVGANMLSDAQLERLKAYCDAGGQLFVFGSFGGRRPDGSRREHPERIFGLSADLTDFHAVSAGEFRWRKQCIGLPETDESLALKRISGDYEVIAQSMDGEILGISALGGHFIWLAGGIRCRKGEYTHYDLRISRWQENAPRLPAQPYAAAYQHAVPGALLQCLLPTPQAVQCSNGDYLSTAFWSPAAKCVQIHLVNVADTLPQNQELVSHEDPFVHFMPDSPRNTEPVEIYLTLPRALRHLCAAKAVSPEFKDEKILAIDAVNSTLRIIVPEGLFAGYLKITLTE